MWKVRTWTTLKHIVANVYSVRIEQNSETTGSISRILLTTWVHLNLGRMLLFRCSGFIWLAVLLSVCGEYTWKLWGSHILPSLLKLLSCVVSVHPENIILVLQCSVLSKISGRLKRKGKWLLIWEDELKEKEEIIPDQTVRKKLVEVEELHRWYLFRHEESGQGKMSSQNHC